METYKLRINDFMYNAGVLGFYRILEHVDKEHLVSIEGNAMNIKKEVINNFTNDYINTMIYNFKKETKWHNITSKKSWIKSLELNDELKDKIENFYKDVKNAMWSASYKSGYESIKDRVEFNPYKELESIKKDTALLEIKESIIRIIEHLEEYREVYCMKDIIYTKINLFWENVAFLNTQKNKSDIKVEYEKSFVQPFVEYLENERKSDLSCMECSNKIIKKEAFSMSWIKDMGIDLNRKKSSFWNFKEDTFICPICNLIYSCIPLGFTIVKNRAVFINNNESIDSLIKDNNMVILNIEDQKDISNVYNKVITNYINKLIQSENDKSTIYEPKNIQVIKRIPLNGEYKYEFNIISKDKLEVIRRSKRNFEKLVNTNLYERVLSNLLSGIRQYNLINEILYKNDRFEVISVREILKIELNSMGGINVQEKEIQINSMIFEGEKLQRAFEAKGENKNKLESFKYQLQDALNANSVEKFMKIFIRFYGGLGIAMPNNKGIKNLITNVEDFKLYGYAYVYGLGKTLYRKDNNLGGNDNEE